MRRARITVTGVVVAFVVGAAGAALASPLTFQQRVDAQRAIEQVYWRHRTWPAENRNPKPPLDVLLSPDAIRAKVEDYLRKSSALELLWRRPVTAGQLQAELQRMARETRDPRMLRELFAALGSDPLLIAECLARPALVERLLRTWCATDERFRGAIGERGRSEFRPDSQNKNSTDLSRRVDAIELLGAGGRGDAELTVEAPERSPAVAGFDDWWAGVGETMPLAGDAGAGPNESATGSTPSLPAVAESPCAGGDGWLDPASPVARRAHTVVWTGAEMIVWGGRDDYTRALNTGARYDPATDTWTPVSARGAAPTPRYEHSAVWTGTEMIVWGGHDFLGSTNRGGRYNPVTDSWAPTSVGASTPVARYLHTAVWTGAEMIAWGGRGSSGALNTGGRYDPLADSWTPTSTGANTPSGRDSHTVVWTGSEMIVWGGFGSSSNAQNTGAKYNPVANAWTSTSTGANTPAARGYHSAVWTGAEMVVWGGYTASYPPREFNTGGRYDPATNSWRATSADGAPAAREAHTAVWTGSEMVVWGGLDRVSLGSPLFNSGARYEPAANRWTPTSTGLGVPEARYLHTAVWTGDEMIVWGGWQGSFNTDSGGRYSLAADAWVPTSTGPFAPAARLGHTAVWTGAEMIVFGGYDGQAYLDTGGRYDPATAIWAPTSTGAEAPDARSSHSAIWTGSEMIVWGGYAGGASEMDTGARYNPAADSWTPLPLDGAPPAPRRAHTAVWTGARMIVWGGRDAWGPFNSGGSFDPDVNSWTATSETDAPPGVYSHTAVWTGSEMIVWGGWDRYGSTVNTGGRYAPASDSWSLTSVGANVPSRRYGHTAVWTGDRMIIWGGGGVNPPHNTGGLYDPSTNSWTSVSTGASTPTGRNGHTAVWTNSEMIIWGGIDTKEVDTGGRYRPDSDSWMPTARGANAAAPRSSHRAVWTGAEMIVWGGANQIPVNRTVLLGHGGVYRPCLNQPPVANAGPDQVVECTGDGGAVATLDGSGSDDPDSTPGTQDDIVSYSWTEDDETIADGVIATFYFALGAHDVRLTVVDTAGASATDDVSITVRDTRPPSGGITFPAPGQCLGVSVIVEDDFADACEDQLTRTYDPPGGPLYESHGDHDVVLTASDSSGNTAQSAVSFTIDKVPPSVRMLTPAGSWWLPSPIPFDQLFWASDDDGASGGVVHEFVALDDCVVYDGLSYGDNDGLLSDELIPAGGEEICRIVRLCGKSEWRNPVVTVTATDCGAGSGTASAVLPWSYTAAPGFCPWRPPTVSEPANRRSTLPAPRKTP